MREAVRHRAKLALATTLLLALQSCFTLGLWGFDYTPDADGADRDDSSNFEFSDEPGDPPWTWKAVGLRVLLTPIALALDIVTSPVQCAVLGIGWLGSDDDDRDQRRSRRRGC